MHGCHMWIIVLLLILVAMELPSYYWYKVGVVKHYFINFNNFDPVSITDL